MAHFSLLQTVSLHFQQKQNPHACYQRSLTFKNLLFFYIDGILKSVWILTSLPTDVQVPVHLAVQLFYVSNFFKVN